MIWILIIWMFGSYSYSEAKPTITTQEFNTESACRAAFAKIKELNGGELALRGVCTPRGANQ